MPDQNIIRIHSIELQNVLQFKSMNLKLGKKATIISGKNETGKSSLLEAIKAGISGGSKSDSSLLHGIEVDGKIEDRESEGKIIIRLDDKEVMTKNLYLDKASTIKVTAKGTPTTYLTNLLGGAFINPIEFYNAKGEDRVEQAMKVLPLKFDRALFGRIVGTTIEPDAKPLETIDKWYNDYFKERTESNGAYKKAKLRSEDMRRTLPLDDPETPADRIGMLEAQRKAAENLLQDKKNKLLVAEDKKKAELQAIRDAKIKEANDEYGVSLEALSAKARDILLKHQGDFNTAIAEIDPELGALRDKAKNYEQVMAQHKLMHDLEVEEEACRVDAEMKDKTVKEIEMVRSILFDSEELGRVEGLEGLEIKESEIWLDGVKWPFANRAKRMKFSNLMAEMSCGRMKLIIVDDMESLDSENYAWQVEHMREKGEEGFQFVIAKVSDDKELKVETIE